MKRFLAITATALLTVVSIVFAQTPPAAVVRTPGGERPLATMIQNGHTYFAAEDVIGALGGTVTSDNNGFSVSLNSVSAAFGSDSRFAVVRDDLIEMPVTPAVVDGRPFVPLAFFTGFLPRTADLDAVWDPATRVLQIRPQQRTTASAQLSVANVQGITKVVVTLSAPVEYTILKSPGTYIIRFKGAVRSAAGEETHEDPNVAKTSFAGSDLRITLAGPDVVGDAYKLENPFRIVLDLHKGAAPPQGAPAPVIPSRPPEIPGIQTIVIDPGHGGKDVGATGPGGTMEKDATLAVSRKLAAALEARTGARVVLTREDDSLLSLDQRTGVANQYKADLFLSVHMNAAGTKGARGSETYFLSLEASDELARRAAEIENAAARTAGESGGASDLKLILWDLAQQEYIQESSRFATSIQEELNAIASIQNRGVKQAPFKVLVGASMPAALVEIAFISNPEEEAKLKDEKFVSTVVDALTKAVIKYKADYETRLGIVRPAPPAPKSAAPAAPAAPPAQPPPARTTS